MKSFAIFFAAVTALTLLVYFTHQSLRPSIVHPLWAYYLMNYVLGAATVGLLIRLSKKQSEILGFAFMGASLLKFALFFALFFPAIQEQETLKKQEFFSFFIPYSTMLISEVWFLVRYLNKVVK